MMNAKENFIIKSNLKHNGKYDYSKVEYVNNETKVCIICPEHGEFWQTPHNHSCGQGCPKCSLETRINKRKKTKEQFIEDAKKIHGNKYDYSKVEYTGNNKTKVCIICPTHGEFWQKPNSHLNGHGCLACWVDERQTFLRNKLGFTKDEFIEQAKKIHGNKYDYSKVEYINSSTKVCIICPTHGEFWQTPDAHLQGQGCPICGSEKRHETIKSKLGFTKEQFIEKAKKIHGDKYDYSKVEYVNSNTKVCIICPIHGEFWQRPSGHLDGHGCPICNESKLEREIRLMLSENNIKYVRCCGKDIFVWLKKQHLDFYLPEYNIAIECQGEQHFTAIKHFGGEEKLKDTIRRDLEKKKICEKNGIKILYYTNYICEESKGMIFDKTEILKKIWMMG